MPKIFHFAPLATLAIGLALTACDRTENAPTANEASGPAVQDPDYAGFSKELAAIKVRETAPEKIDAAVRAAMARYGYPALPAETSPPAASQVPEAAAKTAAYVYTQTRSQNVIYHFANARNITVANGYTLEAWSYRIDGSVDPILVGFYKTTGGANPNGYKIQVAGYNDDRAPGNPDSWFRWKNETGSDKTVHLVSFGYGETWGKESINWQILNGTKTVRLGSQNRYVTANAKRESIIPSDFDACSEPQASQIQLKRNPTNPSTGFGSSLLAFNLFTMRGGFIQDTDYTMGLEDALPPNSYGVFLGYFEGDGYQPDPFKLDEVTGQALDDHYHYPFYFTSLIDRLKCP